MSRGAARRGAVALLRRTPAHGPLLRLLGREGPGGALATTLARSRRDDEVMRLMLCAVLAPDACCIDVGAHAGGFLREVLRYAPAGRHIAVEPLPAFAEALRTSFPDVTVHEVALGTESRVTDFVHVPDHPAYSGLRERDYPAEGVRTERIRVAVRPLDALVPEDARIDVVKIDVEGGEFDVLRGALGTLRRTRPLVFFEHGASASARYGTTATDVFDLLAEDAGLRIYDLDGRHVPSREDFVAAVATGGGWNWLARP